MFNKRHYEAIARLLKAQYERFSPVDMVLDRIVEEFASMFQDDNPNFKRKKFLEAAGYERG